MNIKSVLSRAKAAFICLTFLLVGAFLINMTSVEAAAAEPDPHTHNACGAVTCEHTGHAAVTYTALDQTLLDSYYSNNNYTLPEGNYYLTEDITLVSSRDLEVSALETSICLNGFDIGPSYSNIRVIGDKRLSICNCSATVSEISLIAIWGPTDLYGGINYKVNITPLGAKTNIYGGTFSADIQALGSAGVAITDGTFTGATISVFTTSANSTPDTAALDISGYTGDKLTVRFSVSNGFGYAVKGTLSQIKDLTPDSGYCVIAESGGIKLVSHTYVNDCDATCDACSFTRTVIHSYTDDCDEICNICDFERDDAHTYDHQFDLVCNDCTDERVLYFDLSIAGEQVTSDNAADILGDAETNGGVPSVSYNYINRILTLNGAELYQADDNAYVIDSYDIDTDSAIDITIHLIGENSIKVEGEHVTGIYAGLLTITAEEGATLNIVANDEANGDSVGISAEMLNLEGGEINVTAQFYAVSIWYKVIGAYKVLGNAQYNATELEEAYIDHGEVELEDGTAALTVKLVGSKAYGIWILGEQVFDPEKDDILGDAEANGGVPSVSYDPETNTLTLNNADITCAKDDCYGIYVYDYVIDQPLSLNIHLVGTSNISLEGAWTTGIYAGEVTFTAEKGAKLNITAEDTEYEGSYGIYAGSVSFEGGEINVSANYAAVKASYGISGAYTVTGSAVYGATELVEAYIFDGCYILIDVDEYTTAEALTAKIIGSKAYPLWILGEQVFEANSDDILGDADENDGVPTLSYDPETNTLTMNNANISYYSDDCYAIDSYDYLRGEDVPLNIHLIGENKITVEGYDSTGIYAADLKITADEGGRLEIVMIDENEEATAIYAMGFKVVSGEVYISADGNTLWIGYLGGVYTLTGSAEANATELTAAVFDEDSGYVMTDGYIARTVKIVGEGDSYDLRVGGIQVTDKNLDDIFGDAETNGGVPSASYDPETNTLTLTNAEIIVDETHDMVTLFGIAATNYYTGENFDLNIHLVGNNAIVMQGLLCNVHGISADNLTITGEENATLEVFVNGAHELYSYYAIYTNGILTVEGGSIAVTASTSAILSADGIETYHKITGSPDEIDLDVSPAVIAKVSGSYTVSVDGATALTVIMQHEHAWSNEYTSNGTAHWHECTVPNCPITDNTKKDGYAAHIPAADDGDCTTAVRCTVCNSVTTAAQSAHTPTADDGDCTTAVRCTVCNTVTTAAQSAHTPTADDGDCTTAVRCTVCNTVTTAAQSAHAPTADDGDCTTAIHCTVCNTVTTAAKTAHSGGTATCLAKAECSECGKEYGEKNAENHAKEGFLYEVNEDGKAHTKKNECCQSAVLAEEAHAYETEDGKCLCGTEKPEDGLSTGAVVGIAAGSTVGAGVIGFGVYWFIIRRKRLI